MRNIRTPIESDVSRRNILQAMGGAGAVGVAGCLGGDDGDDGEDGETEFVVTIDQDITSFDSIDITDANTRSATGLVYERLTAIDFDLNPQPVLAESVDPIDDTTVRVPLREGVEFHNGDPFDAYSVKASIERSIDSPRDGFISPWYDGAEIIDDHTIEFDLVEPFSPLDAEMFPEIQMVPEGAATGEIDLTEEPIGTGPFVFDEYQEGSYFRVRKNDDYWFDGDDDVPGEPAVDVVTFRIISESSTQESALRTGEVDLITTPPADSVQQLRDEDGLELHEIPGGTFFDMHFPTKASPYSNEKVRRGITHLIPREDIVDVVFDGLATPAHVLVPPMMEDFRDDAFIDRIKDEYTGHDPDRGVELIEEGFAEEGISAPHETDMLTREPDEWLRTAQMVENALEETGLFDIDLISTDAASWSDRVGDGEAAERNEIMHTGITGSPSPWEYFNRIVTESGIPPACCNYGEWTDDRMEELLNETAATFEFDEQKPMYEEMMELAAESAPRGLMFWQSEINASRDYVEGWEVFYDPAWQFTAIYSPHAGTYVELNE